jgi:hypothetical protein
MQVQGCESHRAFLKFDHIGVTARMLCVPVVERLEPGKYVGVIWMMQVVIRDGVSTKEKMIAIVPNSARREISRFC